MYATVENRNYLQEIGDKARESIGVQESASGEWGEDGAGWSTCEGSDAAEGIVEDGRGLVGKGLDGLRADGVRRQARCERGHGH